MKQKAYDNTIAILDIERADDGKEILIYAEWPTDQGGTDGANFRIPMVELLKVVAGIEP